MGADQRHLPRAAALLGGLLLATALRVAGEPGTAGVHAPAAMAGRAADRRVAGGRPELSAGLAAQPEPGPCGRRGQPDAARQSHAPVDARRGAHPRVGVYWVA